MPGAHLEIHTPEGRREFQVGDRNSVSIGRHPENAIVITDPLASRRHCVIERKASQWVVRDLNSSNGTRINGNPIKGASRLLPGDLITIGHTRIVLVLPGGSPVPAAEEDVLDGDAILEEVDDADEAEVEEITEDAIVDAEIEAEVVADDHLSEADLVVDEDAPIKLDSSSDDAFSMPAATAPRLPQVEVFDATPADSSDCEQALQDLADSLPSKPFGPYDIAMLNARGAVAHAAAPPGGKARQEAVELMRLMLLVVARARATDIHLEPKGDFFQLRIRIDGSMVDVGRFPNEMGVKLTALVKIMSDIDVTQKAIVQEGHFAARVPGRKIDYRVSFAPSVFGQKLVIRVQDTALSPLRVSELHLPDWMLKEVEETLQMDQGMVLVCGPTGSGKTTTLYSLIRSSDTARKNFVTIEDPVEIQIDGVTQIPVDESEGKSFSALLRSVLRQDPDVIMVGEIRDPETARIAMQASITGHMVFSTVHTTSTIGTIFRLLDLGVEPYLVAQGLHLVLAQRLVRQLCPYCKRPVQPTPEQLAKLPDGGQGVTRIFAPAGCPRCLSTGYWGRRAFFELLRTTEELRETIVRSPTMQELTRALASTRFEKLQQTGYALVAEGAVAFDEIDKTVGR